MCLLIAHCVFYRIVIHVIVVNGNIRGERKPLRPKFETRHLKTENRKLKSCGLFTTFIFSPVSDDFWSICVSHLINTPASSTLNIENRNMQCKSVWEMWCNIEHRKLKNMLHHARLVYFCSVKHRTSRTPPPQSVEVQNVIPVSFPQRRGHVAKMLFLLFIFIFFSSLHTSPLPANLMYHHA